MDDIEHLLVHFKFKNSKYDLKKYSSTVHLLLIMERSKAIHIIKNVCTRKYYFLEERSENSAFSDFVVGIL